MPVATAKILGSKTMSSGARPAFSVSRLVGAGADFHLARLRVRLPLLVEGHDDDGSAIGAHQLGMMQERLLAFLSEMEIDQRLA